MLQTEQKLDNVTYFNSPKKDLNGNWSVSVERNGMEIKKTFTLSKEEAEIIRGNWINAFWSHKLN